MLENHDGKHVFWFLMLGQFQDKLKCRKSRNAVAFLNVCNILKLLIST